MGCLQDDSEDYKTPSRSGPVRSNLLCGHLPQSLSPSPSPSPSSSLPPSINRLWRPAAQRNLRNQWSNLASYRKKWSSLSASGRSHATSLVNAILSERYMGSTKLGVLSDMPNIAKKASIKLLKQQEMHRTRLLSSYKDMVAAVSHMLKTSGSMRNFYQGASGSPLVKFSSIQVDPNDSGDGGGVPVYNFYPISTHEELAKELVEMFKMELVVKRFLVGLFSVFYGMDKLSWSDELYPGEINDLSMYDICIKEGSSPVPLSGEHLIPNAPDLKSNKQMDQEVLQVHLTTWLVEVNIDKYRVDEIFAIVGEEMRVKLS